MKLGVLYISGRHGAGLWVIVEHAEWRQSNVFSCTAQQHLKDSTLGIEVPSLSDGRSQTKTILWKATLQFGHWSCNYGMVSHHGLALSTISVLTVHIHLSLHRPPSRMDPSVLRKVERLQQAPSQNLQMLTPRCQD